MTPTPKLPGRPRTLPDQQGVVRFRCALLAKARWVRAARAQNQTLSAWIITCLDNHVGERKSRSDRTKTVTLNGYQANLVLFAFDSHYNTDADGTVRNRSDAPIKELQKIRDSLFSAHQHHQ